ncbi:MAG TPA: tetratricopeptide repeat protein [Polyangiaceae bacterium]
MKLAPAVAAVVTIACATIARADTPPTVWDLGKNPNAFAERRQHLRIENDIDTADELSGDPQIAGHIWAERAKDDARLASETWNGPRDRWLRFDQAWIAMKRDDYRGAVSILEPLAKEFDGELFSIEVWQKLAESYVRLERTQDEIRAYDEVLARAMGDGDKLTPLLNQGEAYMRMGDADLAVDRFRELLELGARVSSPEIFMLAQWDLAIALDRSGDLRNGRAAALAAVRMDGRCVGVNKELNVVVTTHCETDKDILITEVPSGLFAMSKYNTSVYFVPDYEREWYLALGYAALALDAASPAVVAEHWRGAETAMTSYVNGATRHGHDHWLPLARQRLDEIRKRRAEAEKNAPPVRPQPQPSGVIF